MNLPPLPGAHRPVRPAPSASLPVRVLYSPGAPHYTRTTILVREDLPMAGPKRMSDRQLAANRANARRSTGPRTAAGKDVSRYNALTHGILAQAVIPEALAPYESREEFDALHAALRQDLTPATSAEDLLVEQMAVTYWRLGRLYRAEAAAIAARQDAVPAADAPPSPDEQLRLLLSPPAPDPDQERLSQLQQALRSTRNLRRVLTEIDPSFADVSDAELKPRAQAMLDRLSEGIAARKASQESHRVAVNRAAASLPPSEMIPLFARYESALQLNLRRAQEALERLQRRRAGEFVPPPARLDVSLDLSGAADDASSPPEDAA